MFWNGEGVSVFSNSFLTGIGHCGNDRVGPDGSRFGHRSGLERIDGLARDVEGDSDDPPADDAPADDTPGTDTPAADT